MHTFPWNYKPNQISDIMKNFFDTRYKSNNPIDLSQFHLEWCYSPGVGCFEKHIFVCDMQELLNK